MDYYGGQLILGGIDPQYNKTEYIYYNLTEDNLLVQGFWGLTFGNFYVNG